MLNLNEVVYVTGVVINAYDDPKYGIIMAVNVPSIKGGVQRVYLREDEITKITVPSEDEKEETLLYSVDVFNEDGVCINFVNVVDIHTWNEFTVMEFHNGNETYIKTSSILRLEKYKNRQLIDCNEIACGALRYD